MSGLSKERIDDELKELDEFKELDELKELVSEITATIEKAFLGTTPKDALIGIGSKADLWHDADNEAYATLTVNDHRENHRLRSKAFKSWLLHQYYQVTQGAPSTGRDETRSTMASVVKVIVSTTAPT